MDLSHELIARIRTEVPEVGSRVSLKRTSGHPAVPPRSLHHPPQPAASTAATAAAAAAAADEEGEDHGGDEVGEGDLDPVNDCVFSGLRWKDLVEPLKGFSAQILYCLEKLFQLLHHEVHYIIKPHLSRSVLLWFSLLLVVCCWVFFPALQA